VSIVVETEEVTVMAICKLVDALDATLLKPGYFERSIDWTQVKSSTD
jgi:ATP-dependent 26S proteasome regulatory subunit